MEEVAEDWRAAEGAGDRAVAWEGSELAGPWEAFGPEAAAWVGRARRVEVKGSAGEEEVAGMEGRFVGKVATGGWQVAAGQLKTPQVEVQIPADLEEMVGYY